MREAHPAARDFASGVKACRFRRGLSLDQPVAQLTQVLEQRHGAVAGVRVGVAVDLEHLVVINLLVVGHSFSLPRVTRE